MNGTFNHKTFNADHVRLTSKHTRSLAAEGSSFNAKVTSRKAITACLPVFNSVGVVIDGKDYQ